MCFPTAARFVGGEERRAIHVVVSVNGASGVAMEVGGVGGEGDEVGEGVVHFDMLSKCEQSNKR